MLLHAHFLVRPVEVPAFIEQGFLGYFVQKYISPLPSVAITCLYQIIVLLQALRLNYILNDVRMFQRQSFTPALSYVLLTALLPEWNTLSPALIANSFIIWLIYRLPKLYSTQSPKTLIYNMGIIAGIAVMAYYPSLPLVLVVYFSIAILRPFKPNEWFILLMGILTPFYFWAAWLFINDRLPDIKAFIPRWQPHIIVVKNYAHAIATYSLLGICIFGGLITWQNNNGRMIIQVRKVWAVLLIMFVLFIPMIFLVPNVSTEALLLSIVPAAAFLANLFLYPKSLVLPTIIFALCIAVVIYNNWDLGF